MMMMMMGSQKKNINLPKLTKKKPSDGKNDQF